MTKKSLKFIAVIPARQGSKGLPHKNIKKLEGLPLLAHSVNPALKCERIVDIFVSSDSEEYLRIGKNYGAKGYLRSKSAASDNASLKDVMTEFCSFIKKERIYADAIIILYPTYPLRNSEDLNDILETYEQLESGRSLIGLLEPKTHPYLIYKRDKMGQIEQWTEYDSFKYYRRQDYPLAYELSHWACVVPVDGVENFDSQMLNEDTFGYLIKKEKMVNVDTIEDFKYAEYLLKQ